MGLRGQQIVAILVVCLVLAGCSGTDTQTSPAEMEMDGQTTDEQPTDERTTPPPSEENAANGDSVDADRQPCKQSPSSVTAVPSECRETTETTTTTPPTHSETKTRTETETRTETTSTPLPTETETSTPSDETETATRTETETETENSVESPIDGGTARKAVVTRVIDGDTVEVRFTNGEVDTIRLIGVDTPETSLSNQDPSEYGIPDTPSGRDWLLMWGENAESFANDELAGTEILVVTDPESDRRGYYGRLLAYIYVDGESFGHMLLEKGYARVYTGAEFTLEEEYVQAESNAQDANRGLWAYDEEQTTPPSTETPTPSPTETSSEVVTPPLPPDGDYDCGHFDTHEQAQEVFNDNAEDVYRLDGDGDGLACESLP
jgi:micrococcal nuclease